MLWSLVYLVVRNLFALVWLLGRQRGSTTEQDRVRELQRALYRAAKANPKRG